MKEYLVKPGQKVRLEDCPTQPPEKSDEFKEETKRKTAKLGLKLADLQDVLYAEHKHRILVVLQGLDTAGKDSTTRNVFAPISPQGLRVVSFKAPTAPELEHDYLWRIHDKVPGNGEIAIFNRSHYEEVLVVRVQELAPEKVWRKRYRHIVEFERMLADEGTLVLKFFLHISKDEQKKRLQQRLEEKRKNWKWDPGDLRDRSYWDKYWEAYEEALERSSSDEAPWFVVPSDKKWWRDYVVSLAVVEALEALKMEYPKPKVDVKTIRID
jgi:PPK2 family polyphosphate:nucleotide phosphotransferase